jgi:hypothetical protein
MGQLVPYEMIKNIGELFYLFAALPKNCQVFDSPPRYLLITG